MSTPTGPIATAGMQGQWESITRHDAHIREAADPVGWPIARVRSTIAIESGGDPRAMQNNLTNGPSYGLMQIVPFGVGWEGWHELVRQKAGLPRNASRQAVIDALYDPRINIAVGVAILEGYYQQHGSLDRANSAFFLGNPFWDGEDTVNGNTGTWYQATLNALIKEQEAFAPIDVISRIVGGAPYTAPFGFGMPNYDANGNPLNFYQYGVGHGTTAAHLHTGLDINIPLGTRIFCPLPGVVRCVGNRGQGDWGQGCGSFADTITGGVGNVTVLTDAGLKFTFGHVNRALVDVGQRVTAWQPVATSGGMIGPHLHLDASVERNGSYWLLDPIPAIAEALGQDVPPPPPSYAEPLPIPQPGEFDISVTVVATRDNVPVLQRADLGSAPTNKPLAQGDDFEAVYQVLGNDGRVYWVSTRGSRVPVDGTSAPAWEGFGTSQPSPGLGPLLAELEALRAHVGALSGELVESETTIREAIETIGAAA